MRLYYLLHEGTIGKWPSGSITPTCLQRPDTTEPVHIEPGNLLALWLACTSCLAAGSAANGQRDSRHESSALSLPVEA